MTFLLLGRPVNWVSFCRPPRRPARSRDQGEASPVPINWIRARSERQFGFGTRSRPTTGATARGIY